MTLESSAGGGVLYINIAFIRTDQAFNGFFVLFRFFLVPQASCVEMKCMVRLASGRMIMPAPRSNTSFLFISANSRIYSLKGRSPLPSTRLRETAREAAPGGAGDAS